MAFAPGIATYTNNDVYDANFEIITSNEVSNESILFISQVWKTAYA